MMFNQITFLLLVIHISIYKTYVKNISNIISKTNILWKFRSSLKLLDSCTINDWEGKYSFMVLDLHHDFFFFWKVALMCDMLTSFRNKNLKWHDNKPKIKEVLLSTTTSLWCQIHITKNIDLIDNCAIFGIYIYICI